MSQSKIKVMTVVGTRPEIIRLSRVMAALDRYTDHVIVHTGQNYDYELNDIFFEEMGLRKPDVYLDVDASSLGTVLGNILIKIEGVLKEHHPEAVLILGDTNSSISAIMARRLKIPVYHMEAGNRSFDPNVPEEVNRRLVDHIADFNLVYTEHARRHLLSEGLPHRRIYLTGSPMKEVLTHYLPDIKSSGILETQGLGPGKYILTSIHREENVDSRKDLAALLDALSAVHRRFGMPVLVSTHPRTRNRLESLGVPYEGEGLVFAKPFGFLDYNRLQKDSFCVLSDSGTITEESSILGFPAVTVRRSMERPEGLDTGSIVLTGLDSGVILQAVEAVTESWENGQIPPVPDDYKVTNVSQRVVNLILGTARLSNEWDGIRRHDYV
ncbi:MAG: UDP-N-acetylglucosamine 2-epimerase (non-hydrolyzing) [Desulfobacteraceae bacterium]|nr:UDP-N-acetylglucosamine 2-epimerase (non-hydrolyzing) [Desulfobacteraceae bacterium]